MYRNHTILPVFRRKESAHRTHQSFNFTLQVVDAVKFPLAAATSSNAVFAAAPHIMHKIKLFSCQLLCFQHLLEVVAA